MTSLLLPEPNRTEPNRTEPNRTEPNRTEPNRTEPNRTEPNRTEPNRTEPNRTSLYSTFPPTVQPRRPRLLLAGAWLALFGVLALPAATQAQTGTTLVSNIGQGNTDSYTIRQSSRVMMFTTGSNMSRYILSNVEIVSVRDGIQPFDISLCTVTRGGQPTENCNILDRPGSFAAGTLSFGVPAAVTIYDPSVAGPVGFVWHTLAPNTTHALLFNTPSSLDVGITTNDGEDAGHEEGWTIGNAYLREISGAGWVADTSGRSFRIAIKGSVATATQDTQPLLSADATLSGLTLADGGGKAVALNETFAWDEKTYTADVASSVALVTVTPTTNHGRARVTYQDGSDTELSDADAAADGQQVSLDVGANTIEVTVTAEDGSTDETYTATVTRAVMAPPKNLAAVAVAPTRVTLRWDRTMPSPKDLDHTDFPGYRIEGSDSSNGPWTSLVNVTNQYGTFDIWCVCYPTRFNDNTVPPGTTRHYWSGPGGRWGRSKRLLRRGQRHHAGAGGLRSGRVQFRRGGLGIRLATDPGRRCSNSTWTRTRAIGSPSLGRRPGTG